MDIEQITNILTLCFFVVALAYAALRKAAKVLARSEELTRREPHDVDSTPSTESPSAALASDAFAVVANTLSAEGHPAQVSP